jgi:hypothetical protein
MAPRDAGAGVEMWLLIGVDSPTPGCRIGHRTPLDSPLKWSINLADCTDTVKDANSVSEYS